MCIPGPCLLSVFIFNYYKNANRSVTHQTKLDVSIKIDIDQYSHTSQFCDSFDGHLLASLLKSKELNNNNIRKSVSIAH